MNCSRGLRRLSTPTPPHTDENNIFKTSETLFFSTVSRKKKFHNKKLGKTLSILLLWSRAATVSWISNFFFGLRSFKTNLTFPKTKINAQKKNYFLRFYLHFKFGLNFLKMHRLLRSTFENWEPCTYPVFRNLIMPPCVATNTLWILSLRKERSW